MTKLEIGSFESFRYIESEPLPIPPEWDQGSWNRAMETTTIAATQTGKDQFLHWNVAKPESDCSNHRHIGYFGYFGVESLAQPANAKYRDSYYNAELLVRIRPNGNIIVIQNYLDIPHDAIFGKPTKSECRAERDQFMANLDKTPPFPTEVKKAKTIAPPPVELWWQKEQREAKAAHAAVVSLRNDVRSLLGM